MENPFKFGTIVENEYFTDRKAEVEYITHFIDSPNHLVLISPRRFGKSSVVLKALKQSGRDFIMLNVQQIASVSNFASKLLREVYKIHPLERVKKFISAFRIIPTLSTNPITGLIEVSFQPTQNTNVLIEDVMQLLDKINARRKRLVIVLDEFQDIVQLAPGFDKQLRSIMQNQQNINYILLGSQESMMTDIFEKKKSSFYHFGQLMRLKKIPREDFEEYLKTRLQKVIPDEFEKLALDILDYTDCHPYYTQQLASQLWQTCVLEPESDNKFQLSVQYIVDTHSLDYERLWRQFNKTDKWVLQSLASKRELQDGTHRTSTIYSALKKLQKDGYVNYTTQYEVEDPFFNKWIVDND